MKGTKYLLLGLVFGMFIGWALGFLRLPYLEKNDSFLLGFITGLVCVSFALLLLSGWNRNFLPDLMGQKTVAGDFKTSHIYIQRILLAVLVLGGLVGGGMLYRQHQALQLQMQTRDKQIQQMAALLGSGRKNDRQPVLRSILEDVGAELARLPGRTLSDTLIARIAALSFACQPYRLMEEDSLSEKAYSPERGQLLQALVLLNIDTGAFARIKRKAVFAGADLRRTDLKGLDLSGINLRQANLEGADLSGANLQGADLYRANLGGANMNQAILRNSDLRSADLRWAQLNAANLALANLNGANLDNAQLRKADLSNATFQWAQSGGALYNEAMLTNANLGTTNLTKVNMTNANLSGADLRNAVFSDADLGGVRLNKALVDQNWPEKLKGWQPTGMQELQENYSVVNDTADKFKIPLYRLKKN